ncbi:unnamed protein product [Rotaria sordida]|uniref:Uncharacterized protein n=1 Tax=Rotaria sordida TaxID=392033 RepID=A0A814KCG9_9BILA|nr:unnamed protein product [Rotaria sordida]CAF4036406.1 unnamed protein product [Rotaria sordida]
MIYFIHLISVGLLFLGYISFSSASIYYALKPFQLDKPPLYGSIYTYDSQSTTFQFYANFSFHINDNATYIYDFESGPVAITNNSLSMIYFPIQCNNAFQRLFLIAYNIKNKTYQQSSWTLNNGIFHSFHYDPFRQRLFGLRDYNLFTLIIEEYNLTTLNPIKEYTRQNSKKYAYPYGWCSIFDYEENWIVEVRTRLESTKFNAYYIKMDLNLIDKKKDIVTEFRLLPNIENLCTMTYDIKTKIALVTWQHGSINQNIIMMYMNPYTSEFRNETLLLETGLGYEIDSIKAVYNQKTHHVLFMIDKEYGTHTQTEQWMIIVEFHTMKIIEKKQINTIKNVDYWEFFLL